MLDSWKGLAISSIYVSIEFIVNYCKWYAMDTWEFFNYNVWNWFWINQIQAKNSRQNKTTEPFNEQKNIDYLSSS